MNSECKSILIVEDDEDIRNILVQALEAEGYPVLQATNGREGLNLLRQPGVQPCLVLLDLMMPVLNGWEFLKELKKENTSILDSLPVYVISAAGEYIEEAKSQASGFIKKPFNIDQLFQIVEKYCGCPTYK